jgi:hypothetical protein
MTEPPPMHADAHGYLLRQLDTAWKLARFHLYGLTTEECLWRPAPRGLHVTRREDGQWRAAIAGLSEPELRSPAKARWPFRDRPFGDVVAWANVELVKNASEIGYARFLYAGREPVAAP